MHAISDGRSDLNDDPCWICSDCAPFLFRPCTEASFVPHKPSFRALTDSGLNGCGFCQYLCDVIRKQLRDEGHDADSIIRENLASTIDYACEYYVTQVHAENPYYRGMIDEVQYIPHLLPVTDGQLEEISYCLVRFEVRLAVLAGRNNHISGRPIPTLPDVGRCRSWVDRCHSSHESCRKTGLEDQLLPTRLLDLGPLDSFQEPKLISSDGQKGRYVTLSHRWGTPKPPRTTTSNIQEHSECVPMHSLPEMFQDAIRVSRELGFRYLWIDSLCIVQDDPQDWQRECAEMASVYFNSAVTIAALECQSSSDRLLGARTLQRSLLSRNLRIRSLDNQVDCVLQLLDRSFRQFRCDLKDTLFGRAWVLQERILSPRIIYFGIDRLPQVYFECDAMCCYEGNVDSEDSLVDPVSWVCNPKDILHATEQQISYRWQQMVGDCSGRCLTYADDRLPSISGIANLVRERFPDEYCAGLWRRDFAYGLQWQRYYSDNRAEIPPTMEAPSWSWASSQYQVSYDLRMRDRKPGWSVVVSGGFKPGSTDEIVVEHVRIQDIFIDLAGEDLFGQIRKGTVRMSGKLKKGIIEGENVWPHEQQRSDRAIGFATLDDPVQQRRLCNSADTKETHCLLIASGRRYFAEQEGIQFMGGESPGWRGLWVGLLLEEVEASRDRERQFKRIGLVTDYRFCETEDSEEPPAEVTDVANYFDDAGEEEFIIM